jgi:hypothetical protein
MERGALGKIKINENIPCDVHDPGYSFRTMNETYQLSEDYSLLVEASAEERQLNNFFSPDSEESEDEGIDWDWEQAEKDYEAKMEGWMDSRGEE